jgi:hypothetical protein
MCDRHSYEYGYLCASCFDELVSLGANANVEEFLNTRAGETISKSDSFKKWDKEFEKS